ncbi:copper amine oxidase N-terminal domain-containing protein [Paenibacillus sp. 481]|uniref:copper amine oxidase N-terminal domain-containing protein n=1 Tax=Paenibacillus sp. 481 TaxID=2835869 RepID=UPI001E2D8DAB|nr:copper amine oxidase N-terminal domain-containing protein [Paenibacillus sp. 481]UHA72043.1 hypothetical protein KIK04_15150 [Paenibacillus sp. 481]
MVTILTLCTVCVFPHFTNAASKNPDSIVVFVDNRQLKEKALVIKGATFIPYNSIFEAMNISVSYDSKNKIIKGKKVGELYDFVLDIYMDRGSASVNRSKAPYRASQANETESIDYAENGRPFTKNGVTYIPLNVMIKATNSKVKHDVQKGIMYVELKQQKSDLTLKDVLIDHNEKNVILDENARKAAYKPARYSDTVYSTHRSDIIVGDFMLFGEFLSYGKYLIPHGYLDIKNQKGEYLASGYFINGIKNGEFNIFYNLSRNNDNDPNIKVNVLHNKMTGPMTIFQTSTNTKVINVTGTDENGQKTRIPLKVGQMNTKEVHKIEPDEHGNYNIPDEFKPNDLRFLEQDFVIFEENKN